LASRTVPAIMTMFTFALTCVVPPRNDSPTLAFYVRNITVRWDFDDGSDERATGVTSDEDELRVAGVVEPGCVVVGLPAAGQQREYRAVVPSPPSAPTARMSCSARDLPRRADGRAVRRLCVRLCLPVGAAAGRCPADRPVRHVALERRGRPFGRDLRGTLLRDPMGHRA